LADRGGAPLSDAARAGRRRRRAWAVPGSTHDRLVAVLRLVLPVVGIALALALALAPITSGREISFVLSKNRVSQAPERLRVSNATYRGSDNKGQPFALTARSAVQAHSADPVVKLQTLNARIGLSDGPATLTAPDGNYNTVSGQVALNGPVSYRAQGGDRIDTQNVDLDMKNKLLTSRSAVTGDTSLGRFAADRMQANLDDRVVVLTGHARLHIDGGRGKSAP
jgi:lipopolysaccharide export system protein LptC